VFEKFHEDTSTAENGDTKKMIEHPYGIGVLISSISFLIIFRANHGYQRYWNACGDVHHMMSKWLDAAVSTGVYHLQQSHYDCIKPPNYFDNHHLNKLNLTRDREQQHNMCEKENSKNLLTSDQRCVISFDGVDTQQLRQRSISKSIEFVKKDASPLSLIQQFSSETEETEVMSVAISPRHLLNKGRLDGGWETEFNDGENKSNNSYDDDEDYDEEDPISLAEENKRQSKIGHPRGFATMQNGDRTPSLFLQELAHLTSLCSAVALSTLRSDIATGVAGINNAQQQSQPLDMYHADTAFPEVDPDQLPRNLKQEVESFPTLRYVFGFDRTPESRRRYNALRPLPVIGGVSQNEIAFLQRAKGPSAKVTLAWNWLTEFIIRENIAGSLGNVGPPVVSRVMQFLGDGMTYYNHCRKTAFIPFPFPHAQLSAFFVISIIVIVPLLMDEYTNSIWLGSILTFLTVTCLAGLHEVSRELENPFRNIPNEIPLVTLQAMFNESLITMYSGYHPDHFWDPDQYENYGHMISPTNTDSTVSNPFSQDEELSEEMTISELQTLVLKQSNELKLLREKFEASSI